MYYILTPYPAVWVRAKMHPFHRIIILAQSFFMCALIFFYVRLSLNFDVINAYNSRARVIKILFVTLLVADVYYMLTRPQNVWRMTNKVLVRSSLAACSNGCADVGMGLCYGLGSNMCCNYLLNDSCVNLCPNTTQPNSNHNCSKN